MKHLLIKYTTDAGSTITLFDADVSEVTWSDGNDVVRVEGKTGNSAGMNLLEMLTGGSKARTEAMVEEKRSELKAEKKAAAKPRAATKPPVVVVDADDVPAEDEPTIADLVEPA